jgi:hypothetical protein
MRSIYITIILLFLFGTSCTKEGTGIDQKNYYASVKVQLAVLPGTPARLEYRYNGEKIMPALSQDFYYLLAGKQGKFAIYDTTGALLADTLITPVRDATEILKFAWSEDLGLKGWINPTPVSGDSTAFQVLGSFRADFTVPSPEMQVCRLDLSTFETTPLFELPRLIPGQLSQKVTLPARDADGNSIWYVAKLRDPATGTFLYNESIGFDFVVLGSIVDDGLAGVYWIANLWSNENPGFFMTSIYL